MSKINNAPAIGYGWCYAIEDYKLSHLEGRLLTIMETMGLSDSQEKAVKDLVRNEVWQVVSPCFIIDAADHTALREKYDKEIGRNIASGNVTPKPR